MKSGTLPIYKTWLATALPEQIAFVDEVYAECEAHYDAGGDTVVECYDPEEILRDFKTVAEAREYCGLRIEQELNTRWGEDDDPQLGRAKLYEDWEC